MATARRARPSVPRLDAANLAGITTLMNPQNLRPGMDLGQMERAIMGKAQTGLTKAEIDPVEAYTRELDQIAQELGIDFQEDPATGVAPIEAGGETPAPELRSLPPVKKPTMGGLKTSNDVNALLAEFDIDAALGLTTPAAEPPRQAVPPRPSAPQARTARPPTPPLRSAMRPSYDTEYTHAPAYRSGVRFQAAEGMASTASTIEESEAQSSDGETASVDSDTEERSERVTQVGKTHGFASLSETAPVDYRPRVAPLPYSVSGWDAPNMAPPGVEAEEDRQRQIESVMSEMRQETQTTSSVDHAHLQDIKNNKLEQIGQLRMTLEEEGIDTSALVSPTLNSSMEDIDKVLDSLRLKNDRNRYSSLAEEVIIGAAEGIETVFDGTRAIPLLGWRPDYTGYGNTVNVKLHRMRFETAQIVGNIIKKYNISPTARVIMELLPSFFLYPRQQRKQRGAPGIRDDLYAGDARGAFAAIHASDNRRDMDAVGNL